METDTVKESSSIPTAGNTKGTGCTTWEMERASRGIQTETPTSGSSSLVEHTAKESTLGRTGRSMTENGTKGWSKGMESGRESSRIHTLVNGRTRRLMDTGSIPGPMEIDMKASGRCAWSMEQAPIPLRTEIYTMGSTLMESPMAKESTSGWPDRSISETSTKGRKKAKASGRVARTHKTATPTKETMLMTSNMAKACSLGLVATSIRAITWKMSAMDSVKCCGLMAASTRANGLKASSTE